MAADAPHPAFEGYATEPVPQAAVGSPGKDGRLELTFATAVSPTDDGGAQSAGPTRLVHDYATAPFHVSGTLGHDPHPRAATVFVQSSTGGVAQGDRRRVRITAEADAVAHVTTGSSTKVLTMERNYGGTETTLSVGRDAHLEYVPEPTILHAGARFCQDVTLEVAPGGTAVLADVVVPGRLARGERFEFERYLSRVRAVATTRDVADTDGGDHEATDSDDRLLFADATHLVPDAEGGDPSAPGVLGEDSVYGTAFVVAPDADVDLAALSDRLHAAVTAVGDDSTGAGTEPIPEPGRVRAGATELPNGAGVAIRALGDRAGSVESALVAGWDRARRELIDAPAPDGRKF